jgi:predicted DNA-binding ribbon-helix-helix protein
MKTLSVRKRSIVIGRRKRSITLEEPFWIGMKEIAQARGKSLSGLVRDIAVGGEHANLTSAIRLFVLEHFKTVAAPDDRGPGEASALTRCAQADL